MQPNPNGLRDTRQLHGKWRIVHPEIDGESKLADGPCIVIDGAGDGILILGQLCAILRYRTTPTYIEFQWTGCDDRFTAGGEGWIELQSDGSLLGEISYQNGSSTILVANPW